MNADNMPILEPRKKSNDGTGIDVWDVPKSKEK
jgi:hypothetical protein